NLPVPPNPLHRSASRTGRSAAPFHRSASRTGRYAAGAERASDGDWSQQRGEPPHALADFLRRDEAVGEPSARCITAEVGAGDERHAGRLGTLEQPTGIDVDRKVEPEEITAVRPAPRGVSRQIRLEGCEHRVAPRTEQRPHAL